MPSSPAICRAALSWSPVSSTGVTPVGDIPDGPGGVWPQGVCQGQKARQGGRLRRHIDDGAALLQGRDGSLGMIPDGVFLGSSSRLPATRG